MAFTQIAHAVRIIDLDTDTAVATGTLVVDDYQRSKAESAAGQITVSLLPGTHTANAALDATRGRRSYLLQVSEGGGDFWDISVPIRRTSVALSRPFKVTIADSDIGMMLDLVGEDRVTYSGVPAQDALDNDGSGGLPRGPFTNTFGKPGQLGAYRLKLVPVVDSAARGILINLDIYADTLGAVCAAVARLIGGTYLPGSAVPLGSYGEWTVDPARLQVLIGHVGLVPVATLTPDEVPPELEHSHIHLDARGATIEDRLDDSISQLEVIGNTSDHGMPAGGQVTCELVVNTGRGAASSLWDDCLPIIGIATGGNTGGVFFWVEGALHLWSQSCDVYALALDEPTATVYAATGSGILRCRLPVRENSTWEFVGGIRQPCAGVAVGGGVVVAQVGSSARGTGQGTTFSAPASVGTSAAGIYVSPPIAGDTSGVKGGYAGYSRVTTQPVTAFGYTPSIDQLLVADTANPDVITRYMPLTAAGTKPTHQYTANKVPVTDITPGAGCSWVVCAGGSATLYVLPDGGSLLGGNGDNSLRDPYTQASIPVNRVRATAGAALTYLDIKGNIRTIQVQAVACTASGLFATDRAHGGGWRCITALSGLSDQEAIDVAIGAEQTVLTHRLRRVYAISQSEISLSNTRGMYYIGLLAQNLDLGPFVQRLGQKCGQTPFLDNDVGALGNTGIAGGIGGAGGSASPIETDTGGSGRVVAIPASLDGFGLLPDGWLWARRLDKLQNFSYRLLNLNSPAPAGGIEFHELSRIVADAATPVIQGSENIGVAMFFYMARAATPLQVLSGKVRYHAANAAARILNIGDMLSVDAALSMDCSTPGVRDGAPTQLADYAGTRMWVTGYAARMAGYGSMEVDLRVANRPGEKKVSIDDIATAIALDAKHEKRFRRVRRK